MKKLLIVALAALMLVGTLTACGNSPAANSTPPANSTTPANSTAPESKPSAEASAAPETKYAVPTSDASVWQGKSIEDLQDEDISGKAVVYQFSGYSLDSRNTAILMDLYDDGFARIYQYAEGGEGNMSYIYYGYWTSVDDEYIFTAFSCYSYEGENNAEAGVATGDLCTVDFSYQLEDQGGYSFGCSVCLGFANGGQYVRSADITGDGSVQYSDMAAWTVAADEYFASLAG